MSGCRCGLNSVILFSWCYTCVDFICIWGVGLFLLVVMSLLSSWDEMDICVKLLADDAWGWRWWSGLSWVLEWIVSNRSYFKGRTISLSMVKISTIKRKYDKWGYVRKLNKFQNKLMNDQNIINRKMSINKFWWMSGIIFLIDPFLLREYNLFSQNTEIYIEQ